MKTNENTNPEIITAELSAPVPVSPASIKELRKKRSDVYHKLRYATQKGQSDKMVTLSKQLESIKEAIKNYQNE